MAQAQSAELRLVESNHDKFVRLVNKRYNHAVYWIRGFEPLGAYDHSADEVEKIRAALIAEVNTVCDMIQPRRRRGEQLALL